MHSRSTNPCAGSADRDDDALLAVFTTIDDGDAARSLARTLVERRLAACAQISQIESFYTWNGALANEREFRILFKTRASLYPQLEAALRELHRYELPAIHALPVTAAEAGYAQWVIASTSGPDDPPSAGAVGVTPAGSAAAGPAGVSRSEGAV